jgi:hypothetical protein
MAITSKGYPNTIAPGSDFALMGYAFGRQYAAPFVSHCQVTDPGSGTRRVQISPGYLAGKHIVDHNDAIVNIDLPNASGSSQWFCIVLNRWVDAGGGDFKSEFGYVAGTSARAIPALTQNPGIFDQQPIALVRIASTQTRPQEIIDLRPIAEEPGTYTIYDDLAMQVIDRPGVTAYNAKTGITYRRIYNENQAREWQIVDQPLTGMVGNGGTAAPGWYGASEATLNNYRYIRSGRGGRDLELYLRLRLNSGSVAPASNGSFTGTPTIFTLDPAYRPLFMYPFSFTYRTTTGGVRGGVGRVSPEGLVQLVSGVAGSPIESFTVAQGYSFMAQLRHTIV